MAPAAIAEVRRARIGVSVLFLVNGMIVANLIPRMPALKDGLDLTNAAVGAALAAMPIGGLLAGLAAGLLIQRFGSRLVATGMGVALGLALGGIGLAPGWLALVVAFVVLGAFDAVMDAAMNAHGVAVQRRYRRSILHAFHGLWSAGMLVGAATGALAAALQVPIVVHLAVAGGGLALLCAGVWRILLERDDEEGVDVEDGTALAGGGAPGRRAGVIGLPRGVRLLLPISLVGVLGVMLEDAAQTWNTLYLADVLGATAGLAALGFLVYAGFLTAARLVTDRLIDRWENATVARAGGLVASAGLGIVVMAGVIESVAVAVVGFATVGVGTAPLFPVMVAAASTRPGIASAHAVATVSWLARAGFVIAPALVGAAADVWGLGAAFVIPLAAGLLVAVLAPRLLGSPVRR